MIRLKGKHLFSAFLALFVLLAALATIFYPVTLLFGFGSMIFGLNLKEHVKNELTLLSSYRNLGKNYYFKGGDIYWASEGSEEMFGPKKLHVVKIDNADKATFKPLDYNLAKDRGNVYRGYKPLYLIDAKANTDISDFEPAAYTYLSENKRELRLNNYDLPDVHIAESAGKYYFVPTSVFEERIFAYKIDDVDGKTFKAKYGDVTELTRRGFWPIFRYLGEDEDREYILMVPDNRLYVRSKHDKTDYFILDTK
ncbi:DKNYY domain-containing protein [candidate division WWE3 bacterium]|nr:DKNYY domain-containing protein [candidate division WWE3 bacterium]